MLDRTVAPSFSRSTHFDLIHPETITLGSGLQIFSVSGGNQKVIKVELLFRAGRWFEGGTDQFKSEGMHGAGN